MFPMPPSASLLVCILPRRGLWPCVVKATFLLLLGGFEGRSPPLKLVCTRCVLLIHITLRQFRMEAVCCDSLMAWVRGWAGGGTEARVREELMGGAVRNEGGEKVCYVEE